MKFISTAFVLFLVFAAVACSEENNRDDSLMDLLREHAQGNDNHWNMPADNPLLRNLESSPGPVVGHVGNKDIETVIKRLAQEDWDQFTPPPVTEAECHVEIQVMKRLPGRCVKLGETIPACQTEEFMEINYAECH